VSERTSFSKPSGICSSDIPRSSRSWATNSGPEPGEQRIGGVVGVQSGRGFAQQGADVQAVRDVRPGAVAPAARTGLVARELPPPTEELGRFESTAEVDWSDADSAIEFIVDYSRVLAGGERPCDEGAARNLIRRDVERARDLAALQNHDLLHDDGRHSGPLSPISAPTLVIHGTADPMFPIGHGEALAEEIPGAGLLRLHGGGDGVYRNPGNQSQASAESTARRRSPHRPRRGGATSDGPTGQSP